MNVFVRNVAVAAAVASVGVSTLALAATQGTLGATSTGSVSISASVANRVQITGLSDVTFSNVDPTVTQSGAQNTCVWSNTATKAYTITATGSGASGAFTLANGGSTVPYTVQWNGSSGQSSGTALTATVASSSFTSSATVPTCSAAPSTTSSLIVSISAATLQSMPSQTSYTGTLTLLVTPQ